MATLQELENALRNADKAGDMDAARKLAAVIMRERKSGAKPEDVAKESVFKLEDKGILGNIAEQITGNQRATPETQALTDWTGMPELNELSVRGMKTGLGTLMSNPAETVQVIQANFPGVQIRQDEKGNFLLRSSLDQKEYAIKPGFQVGDIPRAGAAIAAFTPAGRAATIPGAAIGAAATQGIIEGTQAATGGEFNPKEVAYAGMGGAAGQALAVGAKAAAPLVGRAIQKAAESVPPQVAKVLTPGKAAQSGRYTSAGSAATPEAVQRRAVAEMMPVPFEGESALTQGQASRNFGQLQFEKESAKLGDLGAPLRKRVSNQTETLLSNFDAMVDQANPVRLDRRAIGQAVDQAVVNKYNVMQGRVRNAYARAREAGEMEAPVELTGLPQAFDAVEDIASTSADAMQLLNGIKARATKYGNVAVDADGVMSPATSTLSEAEAMRQFVNSSTDWANPRQALVAKRVISSIDDAMEGQGGDLFQAARNTRKQLANEFENVGITAKLLGTKGKTNERQIAFEDVFDKVILSSPVEEMNKLRATLLKAGPDGKQVWADMKAKTIEHIKESSLSASQLDEAGRPLLSPDKLRRTINQLDEAGKLESLFGKKQAQTIRDLGEIASVIYTAPPGAINHSNTASALRVALDSVVTFGVTGIPAPAATALKEAVRYVKDRGTRIRIQDALKSTK